MTTANGTPSQGVSGTSAGNAAEDARRQASQGEAKVLGTDQDDASDTTEYAATQRSRIASSTGGNTPAAGPTVTR